jgi:hypothetical protein
MSEATREPAGHRRDEALDAAIEREVREMLDVEPPAGLRGRVMRRVEGGGESRSRGAAAFRRNMRLAGIPLVAAAVLVLALIVPRSETPRRHATGVAGGPTTATTGALPDRQREQPHVAPAGALGSSQGPASLSRDRAVAAAMAKDEAGETLLIPALDVVAPIGVNRLEVPGPVPVGTVDVPPIRISAIEVDALPEVPRQR